jgi:hypothetical protein
MIISEFENKWVRKIKDELLKSFPNDFNESENCETLNLPGKPLLKGSELFGSYEIIDTEGNPFISVDNSNKMKYILYSNLSNPSSIRIPLEISEIKNVVKKYEKYLDEILKMIINDFKVEFPTSDKEVSVSTKIFKMLNLYRY